VTWPHIKPRALLAFLLLVIHTVTATQAHHRNASHDGTTTRRRDDGSSSSSSKFETCHDTSHTHHPTKMVAAAVVGARDTASQGLGICIFFLLSFFILLKISLIEPTTCTATTTTIAHVTTSVDSSINDSRIKSGFVEFVQR
jgi:hypothetical protein